MPVDTRLGQARSGQTPPRGKRVAQSAASFPLEPSRTIDSAPVAGLSYLNQDEELVQALNDWAAENPEEFDQQISDRFDIDGEVRATGTQASSVDKLKPGSVPGEFYARVTFRVTYDNKASDDDEDLRAENVDDLTLDIRISAATPGDEVTGIGWPPPESLFD